MKKRDLLCPSGIQLRRGGAYLAFQLLILPSLLNYVNRMLPRPLSGAWLNTVFFLINFAVVMGIFSPFLRASARNMRGTVLTALAFLAAYALLSGAVNTALVWIDPDFYNVNDENIQAMSRDHRLLMAVGTVLLAPPVEECLYRGVVFAGLRRYSVPGAYLVSALLFAAVHLMGYIGRADAAMLVLGFLQYLPAGLCLAGAYACSGSIFAPILMHMAINAWGCIS